MNRSFRFSLCKGTCSVLVCAPTHNTPKCCTNSIKILRNSLQFEIIAPPCAVAWPILPPLSGDLRLPHTAWGLWSWNLTRGSVTWREEGGYSIPAFSWHFPHTDVSLKTRTDVPYCLTWMYLVDSTCEIFTCVEGTMMSLLIRLHEGLAVGTGSENVQQKEIKDSETMIIIKPRLCKILNHSG